MPPILESWLSRYGAWLSAAGLLLFAAYEAAHGVHCQAGKAFLTALGLLGLKLHQSDERPPPAPPAPAPTEPVSILAAVPGVIRIAPQGA